MTMSREDTLYYAKLAEQAERYEDMVKYMKDIATVINLIIHKVEWGGTYKRRTKSFECCL